MVKNKSNQITILIAEDEEVNFYYLEVLLMDLIECPFTIIRSNDGEDTVNKCLSTPNIDLVLMDIKMPKMDGYKATQLIREHCQNLPIIAVTAYSGQSEKEKALKSGFSDFISKPINEERLERVLSKFILNSTPSTDVLNSLAAESQ